MKTLATSLAAALRGEVLAPDDAGYEAARAVYNGMIALRPRLIARCADVADVIAAVGFGRDNGLPIAIRGGGHNGAGFASVDDGLVIDLSRMTRHPRRSRRPHGARRPRLHPGRRRPRHPRLRPRGAGRDRLHDRHRRTDALRRRTATSRASTG